MAGFAFYLVLFMAGGNDILAGALSVSLEVVTLGLRVLLFAFPAVVGFVSYRICKELQRRDQGTHAGTGHVVRRTPKGGFEEAPAE